MTIEGANDHVFKESWNEVPIVERALPYLGEAILDVEGTAGYRGQVHGRYSACLGGAAGLVSKTVQRNDIKN
ncbi:hypothetical protein NX784_24980 [Massilia pinisoli]|uniref:Uncharacterized protein n=1 Tax=Massilia pinisoli TaxID=1772194 RepID=A0ABT1ZY36_9BURK|nr:hypothetical protein [Massilia pinisoli]MCS0584846.1 hypothetical protein [Massilia pinisoli]